MVSSVIEKDENLFSKKKNKQLEKKDKLRDNHHHVASNLFPARNKDGERQTGGHVHFTFRYKMCFDVAAALKEEKKKRLSKRSQCECRVGTVTR